MRGYIIVGDDLQFHNQQVTVGATLIVDKSRLNNPFWMLSSDHTHESDVSRQSIWKTFRHALAGDLYSTPHMMHGFLGTTPAYRRNVFEVELGGTALPHSSGTNTWTCDTITILCEVTWDMVKQTKMTTDLCYQHRAHNFEGPFTQERLCTLFAEYDRAMAKVFSWWPTRDGYHARRLMEELVASYAFSATTWEGAQVCDVIVDTHQTCPHLPDNAIESIVQLLWGYLRNPRLSMDTRTRIRDDIRTWATIHLPQSQLLSGYGVVLLREKAFADTFLDLDGSPTYRYTHASHIEHYLNTCTAREAEQLIQAWLWFATPDDYLLTDRFPDGFSKDCLYTLSTRIQHSYGRDLIKRALANADPFDSHVYHTEEAICGRIRQGDEHTIQENLHSENFTILYHIAQFGSDADRVTLMTNKNNDVRDAIVAFAGEDIVHMLRGDKSAAVRVAVARRGFDEDLDVLVHDPSPKVRHAVLDNARPRDIEILKNDAVQAIRKRAQSAIISE